MQVTLARVDSRLIHGQVIEAWVPYTGATIIIVANDQAYRDEFQRMVMESLASPSIKIKIIPIEWCGVEQSSRDMDMERGIFLLANLKDAWRAICSGLKIDSLNIGVIHYEEGKTKLLPSVFIGREDLGYFKKIDEKGVEIILRPLPSDRPIKLWEVLPLKVI